MSYRAKSASDAWTSRCIEPPYPRATTRRTGTSLRGGRTTCVATFRSTLSRSSGWAGQSCRKVGWRLHDFAGFVESPSKAETYTELLF
eukprot:617276-Prymnesium_polylepis.1